MKNILVRAPLASIQGNPYQPRQSEDAEHIQNLAFSIAEQGLLQTPVGRLLDANSQPIGLKNALFLAKRDDGVSTETLDELARELFDVLGCRVELAFGHSRLAAFRFLGEAGNAGFERMPVTLRDMGEEELFRLAVTENIQRKDLTPIEEARAMLRYREAFGKTSAEIGLLFGVNESTVRNKMRLVELPETARAALDDGRISENAARRLLSVKDVLDGKELDGLATRLAEERFDTPNQVDNAVSRAVESQKNVVTLYSRWSSDKETAQGLFPLDFEMFPERGKLSHGSYINSMGFTDMEKFFLGWDKIWKDKSAFKQCFEDVSRALIFEKRTADETILDAGQPKVMVDAVMHLVRPPACHKCPVFVQIDGAGLCGRRACFERKARVWKQLELERISRESGIAIYDPAADGEDFDQPHSWYQSEREEPWATWWKEKNADLRLRIEVNAYGRHSYTNSSLVQVISVGEQARETARRMRENHEKMGGDAVDWQERQRIAQEQRRAAEEWVHTHAALPFGKFVYGNMKPGILNVLARAERIDPDEQLPEAEKTDPKKSEYILSRLGSTLLFPLINRSVDFTDGPEGVAKFVAGVAVEIGMPVPPEWVKNGDDETQSDAAPDAAGELCPECGANVVTQANGELMCSNFNCGWGLE